jgi:small redox-active disulfide protein 2
MHRIEVLGPGCQKCQHVEATVRAVVADRGLDAEIVHVTDPVGIATRGVMATPALIVDGVVVSVGRVPTRDQVETWLGVGPLAVASTAREG